MTGNKPHLAQPRSATREKVLAAAERLLGEGSAEFSMRDLAYAAGVSFATPFNQFGSKLSIMRALSAKRIELMHERTATISLSADASERVLQVVAIASAVMNEKSGINRAVMGAIGAPGVEPGDVRERSRALWAAALGNGVGLAAEHEELGRSVLPDQLAIAFRGVLSFWTAGEIPDEDLHREALAAAATLLFGFVGYARQKQLAGLINTTSP
jgi:AcrR family transcriptional regulator